MESNGRRRWLRVVVGLLVGILVAAILLAPVGGSGVCVDSPNPEASFCEVTPHSIVGIPTNGTVWLIGTAAACAMGIAFSRTEVFSRRRRPPR